MLHNGMMQIKNRTNAQGLNEAYYFKMKVLLTEKIIVCK